MQVMFEKLPGGYLAPVGEDAELFVANLKLGAGIRMDVTKVRNPRFHRKVLKLLRISFELWSPEEQYAVDGIIPAKDFDSFREKVLILAGHADAIYSLDGVTFKARSIAFANCGELEFQKVYKCILDVVWEKIMQQAGYRTAQELDDVVNQFLSFT